MSKTKEQTQPKKGHKPKSPKLRNKAYKFRIYPTQKQLGKMEWTLRRCKELYNAALEERRDDWGKTWIPPV
jgi:putative transposase